TENGDATQWEILYGRKNLLNQETFLDDTDGETGIQLTELTNNWYYDIFVRSVCDENFSSSWVGPISTAQILSVDENNLVESSVYPNPTKDIVNINSKSLIKNMVIFTPEGKKAFETKSSKINLDNYPSGIYVVVIEFENGKTSTHKIIKE